MLAMDPLSERTVIGSFALAFQLVYEDDLPRRIRRILIGRP